MSVEELVYKLRTHSDPYQTMVEAADKLEELADALAERDKEIAELREALEHVTELLVDTWNTKMEGDPERQVAVRDARAALRGKIDE